MFQTKVKKSLKRLASKVKGVDDGGSSEEKDESLLQDDMKSPKGSSVSSGYFAVYVGEERQRFMVKTAYLTHPLFKMLLEKASNEFGYERRDVIEVPCSVSAFQEVLNAVECRQGRFDFGDLVEELL
ncbi:unnamed protein product [Rhodiola kirilowii]